MNTALLNSLERAILRRDPSSARRLQPGLPQEQIKDILRQAEVTGNTDALVVLYSWKNGASRVNSLQVTKPVLFPGDMYEFLDLHTAAFEHFATLKQVANDLVAITGDPTGISAGVSQFFPVLWDGATGYVALDLNPDGRNRVVLVEFESTTPFCEGYPSFEDFIIDAIRSNGEDGTLICFKDNE